jgi:uncharacterized protein (TIGR02118 family)
LGPAVEHLIVALWRAPDADVESLSDTWVPLAVASDNVKTCTISFAESDQGRFASGNPVDVLITLGLEHAHSLDDVPERDLLYHVAREVNVWRVDPNHAIVATEPTPVKMASLVTRRPGLTHEQFARHWIEQHAPLAAKHHVGLADYTQNVVRRTFTPGGDDVDGIAELRFRTRADFEDRFYDSDEGKAAIWADVAKFLGPSRGVAALMREVRVKGA